MRINMKMKHIRKQIVFDTMYTHGIMEWIDREMATERKKSMINAGNTHRHTISFDLRKKNI